MSFQAQRALRAKPPSARAWIRESIAKIGAAMPFKSQAQRRKFAQLPVAGKISAQTFEEWKPVAFRRQLLDLLSHEFRSVSSLARELGTTRGDVEDDLRHALR